ncbi:MAG: flagellar filament capping protein FliD [Vicinamibacterales bacterium]
MGSPITLSGFNNIDFNQILTAIMSQESQPLQAMQSRQNALQSRANTFSQLVTRASALQQAAAKLSTASDLSGVSAKSNNASAVSVDASPSAQSGRYEVVVNNLAKAQVTASNTTAPDADTTVVASGGTLTINGITVTLSGAVTLRGLADAINATSDPPARASVVQSGPGTYRLVLSAKDTGAANAFTITNNLTGGIGVGFTDTDGDGTSGDSAADNAVQASDASLLVNNIPVTSTTNTLTDAVPGVTLTLFKEDPAATVVIDVAPDASQLKSRIQNFITQYNDLVKFQNDQIAADKRGDPTAIGRDPLLRQLRDQLRSAFTSEYATGGALTTLSQAGIELTRSGTLELNETTFAAATASGTAELEKLFVGSGGVTGVFKSLDPLISSYTDSDGLLPGARKQLTDQASRLSDSIASMQERLAVRRAALQKEFIAADRAMSLLKSQSGSLANFGAQL